MGNDTNFCQISHILPCALLHRYLQMAGRPAAPSTIIAPNDRRNSLELCDIDVTMRELGAITADTRSTINWLAKYGLLANERRCTCPARTIMRLQQRTGDRYIDNVAWACIDCHGQTSIRKDSFFEGSHLSLQQLVDLVYWWSADVKQSEVAHQCRISSEAIVDWQNFIRDICCQYMLDHPVELGGPGREVEIDESYFMRRKYHQGAHRPGQWVLGMAERGSRRCMMVQVPDRSAPTILPIIQRHVLPGTRVITDGWQAYNNLQITLNPGGGGDHAVVNHRLSFVDPNDATVHTNLVEGTWGNCKAKFRGMRGTSSPMFQSHLEEFMWRRLHDRNHFGNILYWITVYYPL